MKKDSNINFDSDDMESEEMPMPWTSPQEDVKLTEGKGVYYVCFNVPIADVLELLYTDSKRMQEEIDELYAENRRMRDELGLGPCKAADSGGGGGGGSPAELCVEDLCLAGELDRPRARDAFERARQRGLLRVESRKRLTWLGTEPGKRPNASELAYFCGLVYDFMGIRERHTCEANGLTMALQALFNTGAQLYKLYMQVERSSKRKPWVKMIEEVANGGE